MDIGKEGPRGGWTLHAPIHKGSNLGTGLRKLAGSSVITYRSSSQTDPQPKLNRIAENTSLVA